MATTNQSNSKHEVEIDKLRNGNKWDKLKEYVENLSEDSKHESLVKLCLAEAELELYLLFNPLLNDIERSNTFIIDNGLSNVEQRLLDVVSKSDNPEQTNDALILLSKFYYSQSHYDETLNTLNKITIINNPQQQQQQQQMRSLRQIQLLAEAYLLKGLCLERLQNQFLTNTNQVSCKSANTPTTSIATNYETDLIHCFELASHLAVEHSLAITELFNQQQQQQQQQQQATQLQQAQQTQNCNSCGTCGKCHAKETQEKELVFKYGAKHAITMFVPVSACMLFVIVSLKIITPYQSNGGRFFNHTPRDKFSKEGGETFWYSLCIAAILIGVVIVMTIVLVLLYIFRFYKVLHCWLCLSSFMLLFFITFSYVSELLTRLNIVIDFTTLIFLMWNFGCIGMICIHWVGPIRLQQIYLILMCSQMSLVLIKCLSECTTWILLVFISVWDLIAVLCPFGPLNLLVKTAMERNEKLLPALVYSSTIMYPLITMAGRNTEKGVLNSGNSSNPQKINQTQEEIETGRDRANAIEASNNRIQADENEDGVKLGLGDFIFYSLLVGKASISSDWNTVIACFVAILIGLSLTLFLLVIYRKALPALPISLTFGLIFYFCTNCVVRPFYEELSVHQFFI